MSDAMGIRSSKVVAMPQAIPITREEAFKDAELPRFLLESGEFCVGAAECPRCSHRAPLVRIRACGHAFCFRCYSGIFKQMGTKKTCWKCDAGVQVVGSS